MEPVCDLVLLSWDHLEETQPCLESLFAHTDVPCRLFIVDNGSKPHVREFLRGVRPQGAVQDVVFIQHETNEGFPRGMNAGLRASRAPYVCLLNNDLLFTAEWLSRMLEVADAHPQIGVLNPASSTFGEHPPRGMSLDAYANSLNAKRGLYVEVGMCIGFCMVIKRAVIDQIGVLTEEVERIFFEDEDYCMRAQVAGFQCVVAHGAYVFHAEHRTVKRMGERERIFQRNQRWCEQRWGRRLRIAYPRFAPVAPGSSDLRQWLEQLVAHARRRRYIYAYCPAVDRLSARELFRSVGLIPHADIQWRPLPAAGSRLAAIASILGRRKKRFDVVVAPDARWATLIRSLRWVHGAEVVQATDQEQLERICQIQSRSPS